ncbi:MAG: M12 family metallo-peptidase [Verrucomicrobia bacterium]|nr:M12 family metallo-peptidase [Verrucomicrobiota bacterium]
MFTWVAISAPGTKKPVSATPSESELAAKVQGHANTVFGLARSVLVRPAMPEKSNQPFQLVVPIGDKLRTLDLMPYSVRGAGFNVLAAQSDGTLQATPDGPVRTLRGEVTGVPGSIVAATHLPDGLHARIQLPDGGEYWLEPIGKRIAAARAGSHIVYQKEDVLASGGTCAANEFADLQAALEANATQSPSTSTSAAEQLSVAELACDADYEYFLRWGSVTAVSDRIESVINTVNIQYERDVAITHVVGTIIVRTNVSDPYSATDPNTLLNQFRSHWLSNHTSIQRDVSHLFTGKELDGNVIGIAWLNAVCGSYGFGLSQSLFSSNFALVTDLTAHELGHNWGAGHCTCSGYTMNPSITGANRFDPTSTIPVITAFRDNRGCLDQGAPTPPESPTNLAATAVSDSEIDLAWTDNSTIEQGFDIDRSADGGANWAMLASVGANTTTYQDLGLPSSSTFLYRVNAYNNAGDSNFINYASATTFAPPAPPAAPSSLIATAQSESRIDLSWNDQSGNEEGFEIVRQNGAAWIIIGATAANTTNFSDTGLNPSTLYSYQVRAFNSGGFSAYSDTASETTDEPPAFVDQVAISETPVAGSVTGTYQNTRSDDGSAQRIQERESGGKRNGRFSFLEHVWQFNVQPGNTMTLFANAWSSGSTDGDTFKFEYSTNGASYSQALTVSSTQSGNVQSVLLPQSITGTLFVRVVDSNRNAGNRSLDTVFVDHLFVRTDLVAGPIPDAPSDLAVTASTGKVQLGWTDNSSNEYGFKVERSANGGTWNQIESASANVSAFVDQNVTPGTAYGYRVSAFNGSGSSDFSNVATVTTPEGITLVSADGYKVQGRQRVDLAWTGSASGAVEIYRNNSLIATIENADTYTDNIDAKGGGTYTYYVCEPGGGACSNSLTVSF